MSSSPQGLSNKLHAKSHLNVALERVVNKTSVNMTMMHAIRIVRTHTPSAALTLTVVVLILISLIGLMVVNIRSLMGSATPQTIE